MKLVFSQKDVIDAIAKVRKINPENIKLVGECPEDMATADIEVIKKKARKVKSEPSETNDEGKKKRKTQAYVDGKVVAQ